MKPSDKVWLAGAIWFGLGVAASKLVLTTFALVAFLAAVYIDRHGSVK